MSTDNTKEASKLTPHIVSIKLAAVISYQRRKNEPTETPDQLALIIGHGCEWVDRCTTRELLDICVGRVDYQELENRYRVYSDAASA